ncbi:efflux RND transporter periplasmic adaptor subunit [Acanthopleuribacter pedis]|uniref:Efflux RND transporter periplasmic adaptor subunit n=1 Tax=Acanthopleuribacter pedis TaxID=442870 RepID=A0A8J7Q8I3_9BACT|nr:efflux RND transporter periplasmic adaptor subunit [Acanthopleuribacter pedis]MBO1322492.1 efflux RND transporter periplasmic adaptor subunit [Acanthopleuribacter pedis]
MIKKAFVTLFVLAVVAGFIGTGWFLYQKNQEPPVVYETVKPSHKDIVKKTVATGSINPRKEIEIKSHVSGVVDELYVQPGDQIEVGRLVAKIRIIPSMVQLNNAQSSVKAAQIQFDTAKREAARQKAMFEQKLISETEYLGFQDTMKIEEQDLANAISHLEVVREGVSKSAGTTESNLIYSTASGMVLDVPIEIGNFVIESNTFNDGTTIANVADMNEMIFEGWVDESEVGKIRQGLPLELQIGALDKESFGAALEFIAPKGVEQDGAIQFEIRAKIDLPSGTFLRAGYSANADIVLDKRENVLAVREADLIFEDDKPFVEVEVAEQSFEKRAVELGLSDGIHVEVLAGLDASTAIKKN